MKTTLGKIKENSLDLDAAIGSDSFKELTSCLLEKIRLLEQLKIAIYIKKQVELGFIGTLYQIKDKEKPFTYYYKLVAEKDRAEFERQLSSFSSGVWDSQVTRYAVKTKEFDSFCPKIKAMLIS